MRFWFGIPSGTEPARVRPLQWVAGHRELFKIIVLAAVYFVAGKLGLRLAFVNRSATAIWPPSGIALAAVLLMGYRVWPGIWLGAFLVNLTTAGTVLTSIGIAAGNTLEPLLGAWLVERFANGRQTFEQAGDVFRFALLAAVLSTMVSATFGVTSLALAGFASWNNYVPIWTTWWLGDAVSVLILTPLIVILRTSPSPRWKPRQALEAVLILTAVAVVSLFGFGGPLVTPINRFPRSLMFPIALLAAYRFRQRGAVSAALIVLVIGIWGTLHDFGPFASADRNLSLILLQTYMGILIVTNLVLGAAVSERQQAEQSSRESQLRLAGLIDSAMDAIIAVNSEQRIVLFNPAAEQMFGCPAGEALGQPLDRFIPARFHEVHHRHIEHFGKTGATNRRMGALGALSGLRANGEEFPIEASISHMKAGGQKLFTVILRDITERKQAEADLQAWQRELESRVEERTAELNLVHGQLQAEAIERERLEAEIARIAEREQLRLGQELHDGLGQQLTGIRYLLTALHARLRKTSPTRAREARRLETMVARSIEQTRSLARGFYPVELENLGLRPALEEFARHIEQAFGVHCAVQSDGSACGQLKGPLAFQLFRIAQEAAQNAAKHAQAEQIAIELGTSGDDILLIVKDDGCGFQSDGAGTKGMGMRIMRHRALAIGGKLEARNDPHGGATITCSVPRRA
jgi:PAS domain S-box-containing protein